MNMDIDGIRNTSFAILPDVIIIDMDKFALSHYLSQYYASRFFNVKAIHFFIGKNISSNMSVVLQKKFISKAFLIDLNTGSISKYISHLRMKKFVDVGICPVLKKTSISRIIIKNSQNESIESWYGVRIKLCHPINYSYSNDSVEKRLFDIIWDHFKIKVDSKALYFNDSIESSEDCDIFCGNFQAESQYEFDMTEPYIYDHLSWFVPLKLFQLVYIL
ncbi:hypothetical protein WA026_011068 [Henosepilachna vigintioctopunctata]|uniref:Uncharacterized protein n=1 Tax=Henosepilachna vigintioctopunctata TaxID=420089 RepID=A0AAW1TWL2_9CUCU